MAALGLTVLRLLHLLSLLLVHHLLVLGLLLHLLHVRIAGRVHEAAGSLDTHTHSHIACHGSVGVGTGCLETFGNGALDKALADIRVAHHSSLVSHIDEFLRLLVIGNAGDAHRLDLNAAGFFPVLIQHLPHIFGELPGLARHMGDPDAVHGHLADGALEGLQELIQELLIDIVHFQMRRISRNHLRIEAHRIGDLDGIASVGSEEKLRIVEIVEIVYRISRTEADAADLLKIQEIHFHGNRFAAPEFEPVKGILQHIAHEISVEKRRGGTVVHGIIARFSGIINDLSAVSQDHKLIVIDMNDRTVGDHIAVSSPVGALSYDDALGKKRLLSHFTGFHNIKPLICQSSSCCVHCCSDNAHSRCLPFCFLLHI